LFDPIRKKSGADLNTPILVMTATATKTIVDDIEMLSGLTFSKQHNVLWPSSPRDFSRRDVGIQLAFNKSPLQKIKTVIKSVCGSSELLSPEKIIVDTNSKTRCGDLKRKIQDFLNGEGMKADVVKRHTTFTFLFAVNEEYISARALYKGAIVKTMASFKKDGEHFTELVFEKYRASQAQAGCRYLLLKLFACGLWYTCSLP
jgi:hypothetical protein